MQSCNVKQFANVFSPGVQWTLGEKLLKKFALLYLSKQVRLAMEGQRNT